MVGRPLHRRIHLSPLSQEVGPRLTDQFYQDNRGHLGHVIEQQDQIFYVALNRTNVNTWGFWTKEALAVWRALRERTKHSLVVHSGLASDIWRPTLLLANIAAKLDGCKTLFVADIDFRKDAWRFWKTGQWSFKSYVVCSLVYDPFRLAQMWIAARTSSLLLLKSASMVRDFGRGRQNVRKFWDTAHSLEQVIDKSALEVRMKRIEDTEHPVSLIYFGRFVPYKGLDRMIRAVWKARCISGRAFVLDLVGSGDELMRLRACVDELGEAEAIRFNDPLPYGQRLFAKIREAAPRDPVRLGKLIGESNRQDMASKAIPIRTTFRPATPSGKIWILGWVIVE